MDQIIRKKFRFGLFCRFVTGGSTLRPPNTYIFVFQEMFDFFIFLKSLREGFRGCEYTNSCLNKTISKQSKSFGVQTTSLLLQSKLVHSNYRHFFWNFRRKSSFEELKKVRLLVKTLLIQIILRLKATMNEVKPKKLCFFGFLKISEQCINAQTTIYICLHFSGIVSYWYFVDHFLRSLEAKSHLILL